MWTIQRCKVLCKGVLGKARRRLIMQVSRTEDDLIPDRTSSSLIGVRWWWNQFECTIVHQSTSAAGVNQEVENVCVVQASHKRKWKEMSEVLGYSLPILGSQGLELEWVLGKLVWLTSSITYRISSRKPWYGHSQEYSRNAMQYAGPACPRLPERVSKSLSRKCSDRLQQSWTFPGTYWKRREQVFVVRSVWVRVEGREHPLSLHLWENLCW